MPVLDQWEAIDETQDDHYGERVMPFPSYCNGAEALEPQPPEGWWALYRFMPSKPLDLTEMSCWCLLMNAAYGWTKDAGLRRHMICREPKGSRVLVVHPDLHEDGADIIETLNAYCLEGNEEKIQMDVRIKAARTYCRQRWADISVGTIATVLHEHSLPLSYLYSPDTKWLDMVECSYTLFAMAEGDY